MVPAEVSADRNLAIGSRCRQLSISSSVRYPPPLRTKDSASKWPWMR